VTAQCRCSKQQLSLALKEMVKDCFCCLKTHLLGQADGKEILYVSEISSSHNSVAEDSVLQGCDAVTQCHIPQLHLLYFKNCLYLPLTLKLPYCMHLPGITASPQPFWVKDQNTKGFVTGNYTRPCTASVRKMYCI